MLPNATLVAVPTTPITTRALAKAFKEAVSRNLSALANVPLKNVKAIALVSIKTTYENSVDSKSYLLETLMQDAKECLSPLEEMYGPEAIARINCIADWNNTQANTSVNGYIHTDRSFWTRPERDVDLMLAFLRLQMAPYTKS